MHCQAHTNYWSHNLYIVRYFWSYYCNPIHSDLIIYKLIHIDKYWPIYSTKKSPCIDKHIQIIDPIICILLDILDHINPINPIHNDLIIYKLIHIDKYWPIYSTKNLHALTNIQIIDPIICILLVIFDHINPINPIHNDLIIYKLIHIDKYWAIYSTKNIHALTNTYKLLIP